MLFKKAILFTDIHFGLHHNSAEHNQDVIDFLNWSIEVAKDKNAETCIFLGDYCHHRSNVSIHTLNYMMQGLSLLNNNFNHTYLILGNHDMYFRDNRTVHSLVVSQEFKKITLIDKLTSIKNVTFIPWLVQDEWKDISNIKSKYTFGHLEIPGFKFNKNIEMPDHNTVNLKHFENQSTVFSGHFHLRQSLKNVNYIGNPFGHNYSDSCDVDRGVVYLEWNKEPEYINYKNGPRFVNLQLSELLEDPDKYLNEKTYVQSVIDSELSYEEILYIRETLLEKYKLREFKIIRKNNTDYDYDATNTDASCKTVEQIVIEELLNLSEGSYDSKKMLEIFNSLS